MAKEKAKPKVNTSLNLGETIILRRLGIRYLAGQSFDPVKEMRIGDVVDTASKLTREQVSKYSDSLVSKGLMTKKGSKYSLTELGQSAWDALMGYTAAYSKLSAGGKR